MNQKFIESSINFNTTILENYLLSQTQSQYFFKKYILKKYNNMTKSIILKQIKELKF